MAAEPDANTNTDICAKDNFEGFFKSFAESADVKKRRTRIPFTQRFHRMDDGVSEKILSEPPDSPISTKTHMQKNNLKMTVVGDPDTGAAMVKIFRPGSDWLTRRFFKHERGCRAYTRFVAY